MSFRKYSLKKFFPSFFGCSLIGVLISFFSFSEINFWKKILEMLNNRWLSVTLFVAVSILVNNIYNLYHNNNLLIRHASLQIYIKKAIYNIIYLVVLYMFLVLVLLCILAIFYCKGNFDFVNFSYYNMPLYLYIFFFYFRMILFLILIGIVEFFVRWKFNGLAVSIFTTMLIIFMLFEFDFVISNNIIMRLGEVPFFITSYFEVNHYNSFNLEFLASFIQGLIWILLVLAGYKSFFVKHQEDRMK